MLSVWLSARRRIATPAGAHARRAISPPRQAQAKRLEAQIEANAEQADVLDEQYLQAQQRGRRREPPDRRGRSAASPRPQAAGRLLRARLGGRAALLYMGAGSSDPLGIDATNVQELGSRAKYGEAAAETDDRHDRQAEGRSTSSSASRRKDLEKHKADAQKRQDAADARAGSALEEINAQMQQLLSSTKSDIRDLANKIETQRHRRRGRRRARRRIQARRPRPRRPPRRHATATAAAAAVARNPADIGIDPGSIPAPSARRGGRGCVRPGPDRQAVPLRGHRSRLVRLLRAHDDGVGAGRRRRCRTARRRSTSSFPKVPIAQLQPGDLVFFGSSGPSNHHVGIYVGGGTMIEAPHTRRVRALLDDLPPRPRPLGSRP